MTPPIEMMQDAEQKKKEGIKGEPREVKKKDQNSGKTPAATGSEPKPGTRSEEVFSGTSRLRLRRTTSSSRSASASRVRMDVSK